MKKKTGRTPASGGRSNAGKKPLGLIFWAVFFLVIALLFLANREAIRRTLQNTRLLERLTGRTQNMIPPPVPEEPAPETPESPADPAPSPAARNNPPAGPPVPESPPAPASPAPASPEQPPARPAAPPAGLQSNPPAGGTAQTETRDRGIYFTQIDNDGAVLRTKVTRKIPVSDSPMLDALRTLLEGPSAEERRRGLRSLVPAGTRILSATVRGGTAYISFSEEFQYNTFGVEGYAAQLRQIVWTATEFANINDVQILIEGRRVDYLGEGIWIGSPLGRDTL